MYGYSNDLFFAPDNPGINLFKADGTAITGDVSDQMHLWDNGTRINEQPSSTNAHPGTADNNVIKEVTTTDEQGNLYRLHKSWLKCIWHLTLLLLFSH